MVAIPGLRRPAPTSADANDQLAMSDEGDFFARMRDVLSRTARGDLEPRMPLTWASEDERVVAAALNSTLDIADAFIRESESCLTAAAEGHYYREFLLRGMPGRFREGAQRINDARKGMLDVGRQIAADEVARKRLIEAASEASSEVAAAATQLSGEASALSTSATTAVREASNALETMSTLEAASAQIEDAVRVISGVAGQTRLPALNATIEAARAGEAGGGFAVVAGEVKDLAGETSESSEGISMQVAAVQRAADEAAAAIRLISATIGEIDQRVVAMTEAVLGANGLTHLADRLNEEMRQAAG